MNYINKMELGAISQANNSMVQGQAAVNLLKKTLDFQEQAALQLLASLPQIQDPALGNNIDTYA